MSESGPSDAISRPLATITRVEKNYLCAEAKDGGAEWFVRSSSMRGSSRAAWSELRQNDVVEFSIKVASGRSIICDVVRIQESKS